MKSTADVGRVRWLAVAMGMGTALASAPWLATGSDADPSAQELAVWLAAMSGMDFAMSVDGVTLVQEGSATATSGIGDMAIAYGPDSTANTGIGIGPGGDLAIALNGGTADAGVGSYPLDTGYGDYAFADGTGSVAATGDGSFDSVTASGAGSTATVTEGSFDSASVSGADSTALVGGGGSSASVSGNDSAADAIGSGDIATVSGDDSSASAGLSAEGVNGNFDYAAVSGDHLSANATGGNFLFVTAPALFGTHAADAVTAAAPSDDFGLTELLNTLGLGGVVPGLDGVLNLF